MVRLPTPQRWIPLLTMLALAGWFYARNQLHFGTPLMGNWALPGADQTWWQQPGFHTAAVTSTQTRPLSQTWTTWDLSASSAPTSTGRTKSTWAIERVVGAHLRDTPSTRTFSRK